MTELLTVLVLVVSGLACTLGCLGMWLANGAHDRRRAGLLVAMSLAVSLLAVSRWQASNGVDVFSWWLVLLALPPLWPATTASASASSAVTAPVTEEARDA